jgi:hypothetical protein
MQKGSIEPTRLSRSAANLFIFLGGIILAVGVYSWYVNGSLAGLLFGAFFAAVLLVSAWASRRAGGSRTERVYDAAAHGGELNARELDEQLATPPPPSDRGIRPGGPLGRQGP